MNDHYYLGAYWGAREEDSARCAARAAMFLGSLREVDDVFASWYPKARSRSSPMRPISIQAEELIKLFAAGVNRRDSDAAPIRELGFSMSMWTGGRDDQAAGFRVTCGAYNPYVSNACVLELPANRRPLVSDMIRMVEAAVEAWDPDFVNVNTDEHRRISGAVEGESAIGWVTYISARHGDVPPLPSPSRTMNAKGGTIIIVTDDTFSSANERHVAASSAVSSMLARHGVLS